MKTGLFHDPALRVILTLAFNIPTLKYPWLGASLFGRAFPVKAKSKRLFRYFRQKVLAQVIVVKANFGNDDETGSN